MKRKTFIKTLGLGSGAIAIGGLSACENLFKKRKPNILFIMSDDHAAQSIGAYDSWLSDIVNTPNIGRLAKEGMKLENCFVTNSICTPSRASILTGKYGHKNDCQFLDQNFDNTQLTFPKLLQKAGYYTSVVGKWHLGSEPTGFDYYNVLPQQGRYFDPYFKEKGEKWVDGVEGGKVYKGYVSDITTDIAIKSLNNRPKNKPFCMLLQHKGPHDMWEYPPKYDDLYKGEELPEPPNLYEDYDRRASLEANEFKIGALDFEQLWGEQVEHIKDENERRSAYYQIFIKWFLRCAQSVDDNVGRILSYLDDNGLVDNTVVIYTSDQGAFLGEHGLWDKRLMYEESIRMPFLVRYPGKIKPGSVSSRIIANIDFAPTLLDFAGISIPNDMQGESFKNILINENVSEWRDSFYYHYAEPGSPPAHYGIRTERYKLIYYYGLAVDVQGEAGEVLSQEQEPYWELFDLREDPYEMENLYDKPSYSRVQKSLKQQLDSLKNKYEDRDERYPALLKLKNN